MASSWALEARFKPLIMNIAAIRMALRKKIAPPMIPPNAPGESPPLPLLELVACDFAIGVADPWTLGSRTPTVSVGFGAPDMVVEVIVLVSVTVSDFAFVVVTTSVIVKVIGFVL